MLSEQKNRPSLRKTISYAGTTKHSRIRSTRLLRDRLFNLQTRKATSLLRNKPGFPKKFSTGNMRILDAENMSVNDRVISVLGIADQLKQSLNIETDKTDAKADIKTSIQSLKDCSLKPHRSENMENRRPESQIASQHEFDITNHQAQTLKFTNAERDENDILPTPYLGEEISYLDGDSTKKTNTLHPVTSEKNMIRQEETPNCDDQKEDCSQNIKIGIGSGVEEHLRMLEKAPMFDLDNFDEDFSISIVLSPESFIFTTPSNGKTLDKEPEDLHCSGGAEIDPDLRDLLCIESPTQEPDANHRVTPDDYRQALTVQDKQFTCLFCGSNLEIIPFDNFTTSLNDFHDFCYDPDDRYNNSASPYYSDCTDLAMFCPLCCENRLVQNYSCMY